MIQLKIIILVAAFFTNQLIWSQNSNKETKIIKVLSFNILHGATMKDDFNLDVLAKVIHDANPDFVAMQEVDYKTNRAKKYDLVTVQDIAILYMVHY